MNYMEQGREAYLDCYDERDNPYEKGTGAYTLWLAGWQQAKDEDEGYELDESMDGDHESALASAGWGTDEDYGKYDSGDDW
jgi:hypothetical protein